MRLYLSAAALLISVSGSALAAVNAGSDAVNAVKPFVATEIARFDEPWKIAFVPMRGMLITEKAGKLWWLAEDRSRLEVSGVPAIAYSRQGGLLGVFVSPTFAKDGAIYLTYSEPGAGGSGLALARATLEDGNGRPHLADLQVIWRQLPKGGGGQFGAYVAFSPDGKYLFLASGERQRFTPAQDPDQALGKILRLTLDGKPAPGNPMAGKIGAASVKVIDPPADTAEATIAPARTIKMPGANLTPAETWSTGHRNPYGLAFDPAGRLWEVEMGPMGGDELNLIEPGGNYGWPLVSYGVNYDGVPIPSPATRGDLRQPVVYWTPVIAPAGFAFYEGTRFPAWRGSAFIGGLAARCLVRIRFDGRSGARQADRWDMGRRIRDVVAGPDGALWVLEDGAGGRLLRLTPKG